MDAKLPYDIDDGNDYALFIQINDRGDDYFNEAYVKVKLERKENMIIIDDVKVDDVANCGDFFNIEVKVRNIGSDIQDVSLEIENNVLGIKERTEAFQLEEYDEDDSIVKTFSFKIPEDAKKDVYGLKSVINFNNGRVTEETNLIVDCQNSQMNLSNIDSVGLNGDNSDVKVSNSGSNWIGVLVIVLMIILVLGLIGFVVYYKFYFKFGGDEQGIDGLLRSL